MKIAEQYVFDRPREKMAQKGATALADRELVALVLRSGTRQRDVYALADDVLELVRREDANVTLDQLRAISGMGPARAAAVAAVLELGRRLNDRRGRRIHGPEDVLPLVADIQEKSQEHFLVITLNGAHHLVRRRTVFVGTLNQSLVHPREVFCGAITDRAAAIILVHNHPSGRVDPSPEDVETTRRLVKASRLLGIPVIDHIIVGRGSWNRIDIAGM
ncbi:MAG: DNA repair protein RadC [Acidobacteriota bacterium]|jgi:DNA repair protein RadC|nr:DNA repair protein RadC [Acidobacteriota bacterium]